MGQSVRLDCGCFQVGKGRGGPPGAPQLVRDINSKVAPRIAEGIEKRSPPWAKGGGVKKDSDVTMH